MERLTAIYLLAAFWILPLASLDSLAQTGGAREAVRDVRRILDSLDLAESQEEQLEELFAAMRKSDAGRSERRRIFREGIREVLTPRQRAQFLRQYRSLGSETDDASNTVVTVGDERKRDAFDRMAAYSTEHSGISLLIVDDNETVFEHYANGGASDRAHELASGTKSFSGVMAVAAQEDGVLRLDEEVSETIVEWKEDERLREVTIRQLLTLCSGMSAGRLGRVPSYAQAIDTKAAHAPGAKFEYGPAPFQVFGELMRRKLIASGVAESPFDYLKTRILDPCGVSIGRWKTDEDGQAHLPSGAALTARDWARFGQMIVNDGRVGERQVLRKESIDLLVEPSEANPVYGLTWWLYRPVDEETRKIQVVRQNIDAHEVENLPADLAMAAGAGKQRLYVSRNEKLVIVRQAEGIALSVVGGRNRFSDADFLQPLFENTDR